MSEVFIGVIQPFGFPFAPREWMICNGALLPISQYDALFALIGTTYGGDGVNTFAIPDTRGRTLLGQGSSLGTTWMIGETGGYESMTLTQQNLPAHSHPLLAAAGAGTVPAPGSADVLAAATGHDPTSGDDVTVNIYAPAGGASQPMGGVTPAGGNLPVEMMQPYLVNNYCIAVSGIWPSRN